MHAVLALAPLEASDAQLREVAELQGRVLGATAEEVASAARVVASALRHHLLDLARAAAVHGACRRETPVTYLAPDGTLLEGTIDLAFEQDGAWTVVDFKTDRELEQTLEMYRRQVWIYADIVSRATGQPARAILMRI